ncbi:MAG: ATP-binding cassette domain-containing protein [Acholeplasmataceae bacterium]|jgi:ABC-type lipoprotein export system ATPase subunit
MIKVKNIYKSFNKGRSNEVKAVNDVTIDFPEKGIVTLFGHSGSGKTTILNIVGGLDKPTKGDILFEGNKVKDFDSIRAKRIGYVFQNYNLFNNLSVFDNVAFVLKMLGINDNEFIKRRVEYTLDLVNMLPFKRKKANELSGGQQQRVAIARALVKNPDFIIADEPTGNIDSKNKIEVMNILRKISEHKLVILVTHEETIAKYYSDRIITLVDGKIVNDVLNKSGVVNEFVSDNEIYLSDLTTKETIEKDNLFIEYFGDDKNKLKVSLIFQDGTLYIKSSDNVRIDLLNENSRVQVFEERIIDESFDLSETDFEYHDLAIESNLLGKRQLFSFKNNLKVAFSKIFNQSLRGKLLIFALMLSGVLIAIGAIRLGDLFTSKVPDEMLVDKDFYEVSLNQKNPNQIPFTIETDDDLYLVSSYMKKQNTIKISSIGNQIGSGTVQARLVPVNEIKASELIYGTMPEQNNGAVITKEIADSIVKDYKEILGILNIKNLIGRKFRLESGEELVITGISNRETPLVFINRNLAKSVHLFEMLIYQSNGGGLMLAPLEFNPNSIVHGRLPATCENGELEVVLNDLYWENSEYYQTPFEPFYYTFREYGFYDQPGDIADETMLQFYDHPKKYKIKVVGIVKLNDGPKGVAYSTTNLMAKLYDDVQTEGFARELFTTDQKIVNRLSANYEVVNMRQQQIDNDLKLRNTQFAGIITFSLVIFLLSAVGYFFINKSEMLRHIYQINVYRSLGVKKFEIVKSFIVDILVLTTLTSLIGYLIVSGIYINLSSGTLGEIGIIKPHYPTLILGIVLVYIINIISGIIPVLTLLLKSPAEIMRTYDF